MSPGLRAAAFCLFALLAVRCAPPPAAVHVPAQGVFAFRDPRVGAEATASARDARLLSEGLEALAKGDLAGARKLLSPRSRRGPSAALFVLATAYVDMAEERVDQASAAIDTLVAAAHGWTAALEARGDLAASRGLDRDALDSYRKALHTLPDDVRLKERVAALQEKIGEKLAREAAAELDKGELEAARRAGFGLLELNPRDPRGYRTLCEAAARSKRWDDAYAFAQKARALEPEDREWTARTAEIAARSGRHGEAAELYDQLAEAEPSAEANAESERQAFRVQNLPENARRAMLSPKLTRAQAAALAYWLVPEIREAPVPASTEVATDVVDRADRSELVHGIAAGLVTVSEAHKVHPDAVLSRADLAAFLKRLAAVVAQGRKLPPCLAPDAPPSALGDCGILQDSSGRSTSGREAVAAVERTVRAGREGALR